MSKISVIIPIFNVEFYLKRCLDSILSQTFKNFEAILVDDGSTDSSGKICDEYAKSDSRITVIHKKNGGLSDARNVALNWIFEHSDSDWITFVDSDDWVEKRFLESLLNAAVRFDARISVCDCVPVDDKTDLAYEESIEYKLTNCENIYTDNGKQITSYFCGKLYNRELLKNFRFPMGRLWEDLDSLYKILLPEKAVPYTKNTIYYYYQNPNSILHQEWTPQRLDEFLAYEGMLKYLKSSKEYNLTYVIAQTSYISVLQKQFFLIQKSNLSSEDKKNYHYIIKSKLRNALIKYSKNPNINIKNYSCCFEIAFPTYMKFYWIFRAQLKKLGIAKD